MANTTETTVNKDVASIKAIATTDANKIETAVKADLAKTYSGKWVLGALIAGFLLFPLVVLIIKHIL